MLKEQTVSSINSKSRRDSFEDSSGETFSNDLIDLLRQLRIAGIAMIEEDKEKYFFTSSNLGEYSSIPGLVLKFEEKLRDNLAPPMIKSAVNAVGELGTIEVKDNVCFIQFKHFFTTQFIYNQLKSEFQLEEWDIVNYCFNSCLESSSDSDAPTQTPTQQEEAPEEDQTLKAKPKEEERKENIVDKLTIRKLKEIIANNKYKEYQPLLTKQPNQSSFNFNTYSNREYQIKYVCQYAVQIENDDAFQVTRRIIGQNGLLLRMIIVNNCIRYNDLTTKIRLRGKGSGYKEGPNQEESADPLELCVSSLNAFTFTKCCLNVEFLLQNIYCQYLMHATSLKLNAQLVPQCIKRNYYTVNRIGEDSN